MTEMYKRPASELNPWIEVYVADDVQELLDDGERFQYLVKHLGQRHINELLEMAGEIEDQDSDD